MSDTDYQIALTKAITRVSLHTVFGEFFIIAAIIIALAVIPALFFYRHKARGTSRLPSCPTDAGAGREWSGSSRAAKRGRRGSSASDRLVQWTWMSDPASEGALSSDQLDLGASIDADLPASDARRGWRCTISHPAPPWRHLPSLRQETRQTKAGKPFFKLKLTIAQARWTARCGRPVPSTQGQGR